MATSNVLTEFLCEDCVGKNLGIASAGAAGLKELMHVLQATMRACPFWDFAIPFGRNGSTLLSPPAPEGASASTCGVVFLLAPSKPISPISKTPY